MLVGEQGIRQKGGTLWAKTEKSKINPERKGHVTKIKKGVQVQIRSYPREKSPWHPKGTRGTAAPAWGRLQLGCKGGEKESKNVRGTWGGQGKKRIVKEKGGQHGRVSVGHQKENVQTS